jgi:hypothetical protein
MLVIIIVIINLPAHRRGQKHCPGELEDADNNGPVLDGTPPESRASKHVSSALALGAGCLWGTEQFVTKSEHILLLL